MNPLFIGPLLEVGGKLIERLFPDPVQKEKAAYELFKLQQDGSLKEMDASLQMALAQMEVNKEEAKSADPYTSRWRPTVGYVISAALAFQYLVNPLLLWANVMFQTGITPPNIGLDDHLWELMMGMMGLAGWRTLDKIKAGVK